MPNEVVIKDVDGNKTAIVGDRLKVDANLTVQDIEIGAVEIKDHDGEDRAEVNSNNSLKTIEEVPTTLVMAQTSTVTAGTRVQLGTNTCQSVTIKALVGNTGIMYIGDVTVDSTNGFELSSGDSISLAVNNSDVVYIDSSVNAEGVSFILVN
ncbi:hypothetical protein CMI37_23285 [Candidatus Pacearchaeota archaeon]|nr:hypothetical protein [Candidatus Pacearchaeota archaeon]|tara:strand:- start:135 stop:590 length:456 start_codon:yes stop_codon:yes gene_type:complete